MAVNLDGLNVEVFRQLASLAAGSWDCADIGRGYDAVSALVREMQSGRNAARR